jgi:hypothetical protein
MDKMLGWFSVIFNELWSVTGRAKTSQRGALKTGQYCDASYTSSVPFHASFV